MKLILSLLAAATICMAGAASATMLNGSFYNVGGVQGGGAPLVTTMTAADTYLAGAPTVDATFQSTGINYGGPAPFVFSDLGTFLGADSASLSSNATTSFLGSIITLTGNISVAAGANVFDIFSDDGFSLLINNTEIGRFEGLRAPSSSIVNFNGGTGGVVGFELRHFEGSLTQGALVAKLNGNIITAVPAPATLPLMAGGLVLLGGMGMRRRRRKS